MIRGKSRKIAPDGKSVGELDVEEILRGSAAVISSLDGRPVERIVEPKIVFSDASLKLVKGNCFPVLDKFCAAFPRGLFDVIFADPPYFLSNGGITCHAGRMVKVDKGGWDKSQGVLLNHDFNKAWLSRCQSLLNPDGTIWITATHHVLFSIGFALQELGFKILNLITWEKPNPPPNLSCRYFTHSTEMVIWAAKNEKSKHMFNYKVMKEENRGKQMKTVWEFLAPANSEKAFGKHPTQKPIALVKRCLEASSKKGSWVLDPFSGSGTTGVASAETKRRFVGIEENEEYCKLAAARIRNAIASSSLFETP